MRLTPEVVMDLGGRGQENRLLNAIEGFESLPREAGRQAAQWLRDRALDDYGQTVTHVLLRNGQVDGYYALSSAEVIITKPPEDVYFPGGATPVITYDTFQPASRIAWIARRENAVAGTGSRLLQHALTTALQAGEWQGTLALVIDAYDTASAGLWEERGFLRSSRVSNAPEPGAPIRLWKPLRLAEAPVEVTAGRRRDAVGDVIRRFRGRRFRGS